MMQPAEAVGSIPQPNVNPASAQKSDNNLSEAEINALRADPEIADVFSQVAGVDVPMDQVDVQSLVEVAGMVHKLGVEGAVAAINGMLSPEQKASLQTEATKAASQTPKAPGRTL